MGRERRIKLNTIFKDLLGSNNVYFQPPPNVDLEYPCIIYERDNASAKKADNITYNYMQRYKVTYIDEDPDSDMIEKLDNLPFSSFNRHFSTSGLNHDVFQIYY